MTTSPDEAWNALGADLFDNGGAGLADIVDAHVEAITEAIEEQTRRELLAEFELVGDGLFRRNTPPDQSL